MNKQGDRFSYKVSRKAFTLLELLMTVGVLVILVLFSSHNARKDMAHRQLSMALRIMGNLLFLVTATARLEHVYVKILWDVADPSSDRKPQLFWLSSAEIGPSAEWKLCRSEHLPEHCRFLTRLDEDEFQAGDVVHVSEDWITGASTTFASGTIPLREWLFDPSGELTDANGGAPPYRSIGVSYGKNSSPVGCILMNANGNVQLYDRIERVREVLAETKPL